MNRLAKVLKASRVFVSLIFEDEKGRDQSHDVKRASGVHVAPNEGEMVARIRARSRTDISYGRREFGHAWRAGKRQSESRKDRVEDIRGNLFSSGHCWNNKQN